MNFGGGQTMMFYNFGDEEENPVERLIRQDSMETKLTRNNPSVDPKKTSRDEAREFLVLNYPHDVRRNLKGLSSFSFEDNDDVRPNVSNNKKSDKTNIAASKGVKNDTSTVSSTESNKRGNEKSEQKATAIKSRKESEKKGRKKEFSLFFNYRFRLKFSWQL